MTDEEARALRPGDRIRLIARVGWNVNPPARDTFTVRRVVNRVGFGGVRIGSDDGFWFVPQEVERIAGRDDG